MRHYFGKWVIEYNPKPIPDPGHEWDYWHKDYDGAEDGNDNRCGTAPTLDAAIHEIIREHHAR